ncbi:22048_t:CDS:1, partial [Gigaspora rosea]
SNKTAYLANIKVSSGGLIMYLLDSEFGFPEEPGYSALEFLNR